MWNEETVKLIREHFIAVALISAEQKRPDAVGEFLRKAGVRLTGTGGNKYVVTAGGKQLGVVRGAMLTDPWRAWAEWQRLPASERRPGAVQVPELTNIDPTKIMPQPPTNGLILKLYYRTLARESGDELRHVDTKDFVQNLSFAKKPSAKRDAIARVIRTRAYFEAQPDFMWLTEAEWKSLLPAHPSKGNSMPVPTAIMMRLFRYHLTPIMAFGESLGWQSREEFRGGKLTLTVEEVKPDKVRMRLNGYALLGFDYDTVEERLSKNRKFMGYEPSLLGYLEYNPAEMKITRFDFLALGDAYGMEKEGGECFYRKGREPLGVAFSVADPNIPANRVAPRGAKGEKLAKRYFATNQ